MFERFFQLSLHGTSVRQECLAGLTIFMSMCYLMFVVPLMLSEAGIPRESAFAATIWVTILATLIMGLFANFPVGVAPGLGITAFFAYYICGPGGYSWQTGLGAVFLSGLFFLLLSVTRIRQMIINAVPMDLKYAVVVGIGFFIAFVGLKSAGLVVADASTFVKLGRMQDPGLLLSLFGLVLTGTLLALKVRGAMVLGILSVSALSMLFGLSPLPSGDLISFRFPWPTETFLALDIPGALSHGLFSIIFTLTMVDLFDNMGVLIALAQKAGFFQKDGRILHLDQALISDSLATIISSLAGATTATSYLESASGVAEGGRTGLTAVVIALLFFLSLFCTPLLMLVPGSAIAPVLILIGAMMMQEVVHINFRDFTVALPAFVTIATMPLTFNIANGFGLGFISYVLLKLGTGRFRELNPVIIVICGCFAVIFALRS